MKRKKFIKMMMSVGYPRNAAAKLAEITSIQPTEEARALWAQEVMRLPARSWKKVIDKFYT